MAYTNIDKSSLHFNTVLWTADTNDNRAITGVGFQPDLVWLKDRDQAVGHDWYDAVRGAGYFLQSNTTGAQGGVQHGVKSFDSDGFTLGTSWGNISNNDKYVGWNWKAGNSAGSSNTDGDITSTVSANTTAGFSIVKYTGNGSASNIGHGLGAAPKCVIIKKTSASADWLIGHVGNHETLPWKYGINFNTDAVHESGSYFADTAPTTSVFRVEANSEVNSNGATYIAYCFAEKTGYSKFNKYEGNSDVNGPFIFCGFKPAWVMIKCKGLANQSWTIFNNGLDSFNEMTNTLQANTNGAEDGNTTYNDIDFLSNGFKIREDNDNINASGQSYIYMAFAEAPLVGSNNVPCTAR